MSSEGRKRLYCTDLEGPVTKNDNAAELAASIMPQGAEFFRRVSLYDDYLAEVLNKVGYRAGDTLRLILPFMMAHGLSSKGMREFSREGILIVPGADEVLRSISAAVPAYIISTSYCEYVHAVCDVIEFPEDQTFCTRVDLDDYAIPEDEVKQVQELAGRVLSRPPIDIPPGAEGLNDLSPEDQETIADLDDIFWRALPELSVYTIVDEVRTIGGPEKAESIRRAASYEGVEVGDVMYVGDSITDVAAFRTVRDAGGLAVSFNGNRWAVEEADMAVVAQRADPLLSLANAFLGGGRSAIEDGEWFGGAEGTLTAWLASVDVEAVVQRSEQVRKQVRGEVIGRLG